MDGPCLIVSALGLYFLQAEENDESCMVLNCEKACKGEAQDALRGNWNNGKGSDLNLRG